MTERERRSTDLVDNFLLKSVNGLQHLLRLNHAGHNQVQILSTVELLMEVLHL